MFKRIVALILMALIVISCPACAQKDHGDTATTDATVASTSTAEQTTVEETKSEEEKLFDTTPT